METPEKKSENKKRILLLEKGIFIDMKCNGITPIEDGWVIPMPLDYETDKFHEFMKDFTAFTKKWFQDRPTMI